MWKIVFTAAIALGVAAGCATEVIEVPLPADHPASVSAAPAPRPSASMTLHADHQTPLPQDAAQAPAGHDAHASHGQPAPTTAATPATQAAAAHVCPMHPEVIQATPGACPKCGMKLVPKGAAAQGGHEGHP